MMQKMSIVIETNKSKTRKLETTVIYEVKNGHIQQRVRTNHMSKRLLKH